MRFCSCATRSNLAVHVRVAAGSSPNRGKMGRGVSWLRPQPSTLHLPPLWCQPLFQDSAHHPAVRHPFLPFQVNQKWIYFIYFSIFFLPAGWPPSPPQLRMCFFFFFSVFRYNWAVSWLTISVSAHLSIRGQYGTAVCVVSGGSQRRAQWILLARDRDIRPGGGGRFAARRQQQQQRRSSSQPRYWAQRQKTDVPITNAPVPYIKLSLKITIT